MRRDAIAVFLLQPSGPPNADTMRQPMLGDGGVEICGKIWFVSMTAQSGRELTPPSEDDGSMFDHVESLGLGGVPAAVFNPMVTIPTVRIYPKGLSAETEFDIVEVADREMTVDDIKRAIDEVHEEHLCTPDAQISGNSMWCDAQKLHASSNAEAIAQTHVKIALSLRLFNCDVRPEQPMKAGRVDLEVVQRLADGVSIIPAEIEIKVLRERNRRGRKWSDAFNEKWMRRGIRQAAAYRDVRKAKAGMLCCFDMRDGDRGETNTLGLLGEQRDRLWSPHIPAMLGAYFSEMSGIVESLGAVLRPGASIWAVVGDSRYAGVAVNVADILAELAVKSGFQVERNEILREMRTSAQQGGQAQLAESLLVLRRD